MDNYPKDPDALYMRSIGNPSIALAIEIEKKQDELDAMYADGVQDYSDLRISALEAPKGSYTITPNDINDYDDDACDAIWCLYDDIEDDAHTESAKIRIATYAMAAFQDGLSAVFVWREK